MCLIAAAVLPSFQLAPDVVLWCTVARIVRRLIGKPPTRTFASPKLTKHNGNKGPPKLLQMFHLKLPPLLLLYNIGFLEAKAMFKPRSLHANGATQVL